MRKFVFALLLTAFMSLPAMAANVVPGDVIVVMENPSKAAKVSAASLGAEGEHGSYVASVASSVEAKVANTYATLSEAGNDIVVLMHSDTKSETELLAVVRAIPGVKGASLNYIRQPSATPNDRYWNVYPDENGMMWGMKAINADKVWDAGHTGSDKVYVAVIDSGIDVSHPDLAANVATEYCKGFDAKGNIIADYSDIYNLGHGTHVSGIIGAVGNNGTGVVGVGWNTKIIMLKPYVVGRDGVDGFPDDLTICALEEVARLRKSGVNIAAVNMSLGGWDNHGAPEAVSNSSDPYWSALKLVSDAGVVLCVSAGNEGQRVGYPAPCDDPSEEYSKGDYVYPASFRSIPNMIVIAAAKYDEEGNIVRSALCDNESNSNYGSEYVDIAAPGFRIVSAVPNNYKTTIYEGRREIEVDADESDSERVEDGVKNYASWPGTSMAAPHVAGAVALLKAAYPSATGAQIKQALLEGANGNYCKNDRNSVSYEYEMPKIPHVQDDTSRCGFLDVKEAFDLLPEIMSEGGKSSGSSSG